MNSPAMKPSIVLLANAYPYGDWEPYLVPEVDTLSKEFDLSIISLSIRADQKNSRRPVPAGVRVLPIPLLPTASYVAMGVPALGSSEFWAELGNAVRGKQQKAQSIVYTAKIWTRAKLEAKRIADFVRKHHLDKNPRLVFYAYRMEYQAYLCALLKREFPHAKVIVRGHATDLEIEHRPNHRVPFREIGFEAADKLVVISEYNLNYLRERYPQFEDKMVVSYLGTYDRGIAQWSERENEVRLLSVSHMGPTKRVPLIVSGIKELTKAAPDLKVTWTHYGVGDQMEQVKSAAAKLPNTVSVSFEGQVDNRELIQKLLKDEYDLLVNTSAREGLPVSMMEAMSLGIPVVGTPVAGVPEIVKPDYNGWLIDNQNIPASFAEKILKYVSLEGDEKQQLRDNARKTWENQFSAVSAFGSFSELIKSLF